MCTTHPRIAISVHILINCDALVLFLILSNPKFLCSLFPEKLRELFPA